MATYARDFDLSMDELRDVARFAAQSAERALPLFEKIATGDPRPRATVEAAWHFAYGASRTNLQKVNVAAAYLHPLAKATQVAHILRASAHVAQAAELKAGGDPDAGYTVIEQARQPATPILIDVLSRYPRASEGTSRTAALMKMLDNALRLAR